MKDLAILLAPLLGIALYAFVYNVREKHKRKLELESNVPEVGQKYGLGKPDNPFNIASVEIVAVKNGYVQFKFYPHHAVNLQNLTIKEFNSVYSLVP